MILSIYKNPEREIIAFVLPEKATEVPVFPEELIKEGLGEISSSPKVTCPARQDIKFYGHSGLPV